MDPNLFHLDWERTFELVAAISVLAVFIERALSVIFEHRIYVNRFANSGFKEIIAAAVGILICYQLQLDALSILILTEHTSALGYFITGLIVAGGSKGSRKLFHHILAVYSNSYADKQGLARNDGSPGPGDGGGV